MLVIPINGLSSLRSCQRHRHGVETPQTYPASRDDFLLSVLRVNLASIGSSTTPPLYDHDSWNHHKASQTLLPRSSNIAEGWFNGFASLVNCHKPSIWSFLDCVKKELEQAITDMKIANILTRRPFKRAAKWEKFDADIQRIVDDYDNYGDDLEFLRAIGSRELLDPEFYFEFY